MNINKKAVLLALLLTLSCVVLVSSPTAVGRQPDITANLELTPGDAVAPHLYDWYFDGVDDDVYIPQPAYGASVVTVLARYYVFQEQSSATAYHFAMLYGKALSGPPWDYGILLDASDHRGSNAVVYAKVVNTADGSSFYREHSFRREGWVVVGGGIDASGYVYLYVNGALDSYQYDPNQYPNHPMSDQDAYVALGGKALVIIQKVRALASYYVLYTLLPTQVDLASVVSHVLSTNGLRVFIDPTFYNGTHFIDLSPYGNHGVGYGGVARVPAESKWLYLVKGLHSDGLVHFRFFPRYSTVYLYDGAGLLKHVFVIDGATNQAGLVEDFAIWLPPGTYTVWVFLDWAMPMPLSIVASTSKQWYGLGENVILRAECINSITGDRITEQIFSVNATITLPDGTQYNMTLSDDGMPPDDVGGDGVFHGMFTSTDQVGTYFFEVRMSVGVFDVVGLGSFAVGSITEEIQSTMMSWHDPSLLERVVWVGTAVIAISIVFSLFALYSTMVRTGWVARHRMLVILGGWALVFTIQLAYIATNPVVVYGVFYNVTSRGFEYSTTPNPVLTPVIGVTLATGVVTVASFLTGYLRDQVVRMRRRYAQL